MTISSWPGALGEGLLKLRSLIAAVGEELRKGNRPHGVEDEEATVAVLYVGWMNDDVQREAKRVDKNMSLLSFDFLSCVVASRVDRGPPFSALFTLWLSMIAAVGLASVPPARGI